MAEQVGIVVTIMASRLGADSVMTGAIAIGPFTIGPFWSKLIRRDPIRLTLLRLTGSSFARFFRRWQWLGQLGALATHPRGHVRSDAAQRLANRVDLCAKISGLVVG